MNPYKRGRDSTIPCVFEATRCSDPIPRRREQHLPLWGTRKHKYKSYLLKGSKGSMSVEGHFGVKAALFRMDQGGLISWTATPPQVG